METAKAEKANSNLTTLERSVDKLRGKLIDMNIFVEKIKSGDLGIDSKEREDSDEKRPMGITRISELLYNIHGIEATCERIWIDLREIKDEIQNNKKTVINKAS